MIAAVRITAQILLFGVAIVVFYLGLGVGLAVNPLAGTLLWVAAGAIGVLNLAWIVWSFRKRG